MKKALVDSYKLFLKRNKQMLRLKSTDIENKIEEYNNVANKQNTMALEQLVSHRLTCI